jgi:Zinc finger, C2H2 type
MSGRFDMLPSPAETSNVGFRCDFCGRAFRSADELRRHRASEHASRPFAPRCEVCRETFETPADLKAHNQRVHGAPRD